MAKRDEAKQGESAEEQVPAARPDQEPVPGEASAPVHRQRNPDAGDVTHGGTLDDEGYAEEVNDGVLNAALQPVRTALVQPETEEVEVHATGEKPSGVLAGDQPAEAPKGVTRVIRDEREVNDVAPRVVTFNMDEFEHEGLRRLNQIAGRRLTVVRGDGKARSHGFQTLISVDTLEQVRAHPGGLIPDGMWVNVNYLPEDYLASLRD